MIHVGLHVTHTLSILYVGRKIVRNPEFRDLESCITLLSFEEIPSTVQRVRTDEILA